MYKYKRGIGNIDSARNIEYTLSNKAGICFSMSAALDAKKPYNGMYIKNGKILLENVVEKFELKNKTYKISRFNTKTQVLSTDEYIVNIDLEKNIFKYDLDDIQYTKRIGFEEGTDVMCIEYEINNKSNHTVTFTFLPLVTYRELYKMKNSQALKFNQRKNKNGVVINLSVTDSENLLITTREMEYTSDSNILNNIKHEYISNDLKKQVFIEDLFIPGNFNTKIKANTNKKIDIYISTQEIDIDCISASCIFEENEKNTFSVQSGIEDSFVELKELATSIDMLNLDNMLVSSLPYNKDYSKIFSSKEAIMNSNTLLKDIEHLTEIVRAVDGEYLTFSKIKEAKQVLVKVRRYIKNLEDIGFEDIEILRKINLLKLWFVESANRVFQKDGEISIYEEVMYEIIYSIINSKNKDKLLVDIESVSLMYNALKVYLDVLDFNKKQDIVVFEEADRIKTLINNSFWVEERNLMRHSLEEEELYPSADMIYTLALSHPCVVGSTAIKILDTIFKELYTPYGLRRISKNNENYDGNIYPMYMGYFVKANLRQNGVTRASQKIAYNLVKELLQDVSRYVNGGIKKVYNDKGVNVDLVAYDLLTNAEVIRLYNMLS